MDKLSLDYFYYRCYDFLKIFKSYDLFFAALHLMSMITGYIIILLLSWGDIFDAEDSEKLVLYIAGIAAYFLPLTIYYFKCFRNRKYKDIINRYKLESRFSRMSSRFILGVVIIFLI
jgi:hypothetical protein